MVNDLTDSMVDEVLTAAEGKVVVDVWAAWCGPCRMLGPILEDLSNDQKIPAKFYKLNADENPALVEKYSITSLPTVLIFEKGNVVNTVVGVRPPNMYKELLL
jgi:thioredoxin 1